MSIGFLSGGDKNVLKLNVVIFHNLMDILKTIELYNVNGWIILCLNYIPITLFKKYTW
jgi:hypothetical protein